MLQGLAAAREVVIFDNPRAGLSNDSSTAPLSIEGMAASTMELLRALELEQPDVQGFSLGGMVALALAAEYSAELGAVVSGGHGRRDGGGRGAVELLSPALATVWRCVHGTSQALAALAPARPSHAVGGSAGGADAPQPQGGMDAVLR